MKKLCKPRVGDLVRISPDYPNTEAAGKLALVIETLGIQCVLEPIDVEESAMRRALSRYGKTWCFARGALEVISQCK